jgi:signal transduction histidine kinase
LVRKIVHHSQRTRDLISSLLSFAQQSSGEKMMVDLTALLQRSVHMQELQRHDQKIRIETSLEPNLPKSGETAISCSRYSFRSSRMPWTRWKKPAEDCFGSAPTRKEEVVVQFSDSGPGIKEPHRVFDPFYTTKPIGKGTGLGLSAAYGVVQDHRGQITCQNNPEGGAMFTLRLPVLEQERSAGASRRAGLTATSVLATMFL